MILVEDFIKTILSKKINFFTGVPDSVLKKLSLHLDNLNKYKHIIATNEGSAIALASGYYLSKKKPAAVYMQNSGLGNAINPLISLTHHKVYSIPMLLIIGWRGSPYLKKDEPQHLAQGKITAPMLKLLNIKTCVIRNKSNLQQLSRLISYSKKRNRPVACLIEKGTLIAKKNINKKSDNFGVSRAYVLEKILNKLKKKTNIISTTGYTSRELHQIRKMKRITKGKDFYMVGAMGHSSMVALGSSLHSKKHTLCLDGDGAILMHLGALSLTGNLANKNFKHIILNNFSHESVGGQKTLAEKIDFKKLSYSLGYKKYYRAFTKSIFDKKIVSFLNKPGPSLFEIKIKPGVLKNLIRPNNLINIKKNFQRN